MARQFVRENVPLSRVGVLVAQLESIVTSAPHKPPDPLLCFDLLSDLISAVDEEPQESIVVSQRKCEDALYALLVLGARRPVRHLASVAMAKVMLKGDTISVYSRVSSLQGFLSDGKKSEPQRLAGAAQCLGELYRSFKRRITSGLLETSVIAGKLLKSNEDFVRQEALHMLQNALEGSSGHASASAYAEAFRIIMRFAVGDKSFIVRKAAARCLKAFANIGGPGLGLGELESSMSYCVKALEDPVSSVRDAFAEALGTLLALGISPESQSQLRVKGHFTPKKLEGGIQKHLCTPFIKATGVRVNEIRVGLTLSWVSLLQAIRLKFHHPESELQMYAVEAMNMLRSDITVDAQSLACVLYILRVGVTDQMSEPAQRIFLVFLANQLQSTDATPSFRVAALRTLSHTLKILGEVPQEFKEVLDSTVVAAVSNDSSLVRVEAALTLRTVAETDPSCIGGLISYAVTMLNALRDNVSFGKGNVLKLELELLHGEAAVLAALVAISPGLPLGYPSRLPLSVLEVSKKLLMEYSRNPIAAAVENEAGWMLLSSLLASMPKEELEDQVFDILSMWASLFDGNPDINQIVELTSAIRVWSAAIDALTSFIKCFISDGVDKGIFIHPVLLYLSRALSYISYLAAKDQVDLKPAVDVFIIRTLIAFQTISDPTAYKSDHPRILQICTTPYRDASRCVESSCLRVLLDKRDAWLGPWTPGRDWFEDELRSFQGGKDGILPCLWESEPHTFPQPETVSKMLVNQMLLCFGTLFASQDSSGMLSLLGMMEQGLKSGRKQAHHMAHITNICVGLLAGLKALLALRPEPLGLDVLSAAQSIFQGILAEVDISPSQRRASSEGLGLLARLGNDMFAARLTKMLLGEANLVTDLQYGGSLALSLGCIHRSAGGMTLSSLVPATVNSISSLAKSSTTNLQIWSLHGLLLTIEAAGLSYVSHVQATLALAMDILLSEESGLVDLQQGVGRLINAIIAVIGPELAPGSIFFSRCKSVIAEISSRQETATVLESVRFTQQLVFFAPQAVTVHFHVQTLLPTLSSRQPTLRHLALSTLRHLVEKDPESIIDEQIEEALFYMLDQETDAEIANIARNTIKRLVYAACPFCPSHWLSICRSMILSSSWRREASDNSPSTPSTGSIGEAKSNFGDDENMVSTFDTASSRDSALDFGVNSSGDTLKYLRYRTRAFAAECLSHLPEAVGKNPAHFDLSMARSEGVKAVASGDCLVLQLQDLIGLAYQISTIQFEKMRPIGVALLSTIIDKFEMIADPDLPGHLLLEQYQAQLLSAVRTALDSLTDPIILEAGLQLATKILTCGVVSRDQVAVKRIFSLISRPLNDFNDLYFPSYAEWVSCKIKIRLLAAHASLKCYAYRFLREENRLSEECQALLPLFSKNSDVLGVYWLSVLKDYCYIRFRAHPGKEWKHFLDGVQSSLVSYKLQPCLVEAWPVILQAAVLDATPEKSSVNGSPSAKTESKGPFMSEHAMVELSFRDHHFLWGFCLLVLFQGQDVTMHEHIIPVYLVNKSSDHIEDSNALSSKFHEIILPVIQCISLERFFTAGFVTVDACREFLQVFLYSVFMDNTWDSLPVSVLLKVLQECPEDFLGTESFSYMALELCLASLFKFFGSFDATSSCHLKRENIISASLAAAATLFRRIGLKMQLKFLLAFLLTGCKFTGESSTELCLSRANDFFQSIISSLTGHIHDTSELGRDDIYQLIRIIQACLNSSTSLSYDCIQRIHMLENKRSDLRKLPKMKLAFSLEHAASFALVALEVAHIAQKLELNDSISVVLRHSKRCFEAVLRDSDEQVQSIGLQVLKGLLVKRSTATYSSFEILFVGELVEEILILIRRYLVKPTTKESVAIISDCLKILMLLQALPKASESQKCLLNILLEALLMVFTASENSRSQELIELKSSAMKLVAQLAQSATSASNFKDVLLEMPIERRQQLQGTIRASVTHDHQQTQKVSATPPLIIKLPTQSGESAVESSNPSTTKTEPADDSIEEEEDDDDDDDWDTFQSFPGTAEEISPDDPATSIEVSNLDANLSVSSRNAENSATEGSGSFLQGDDLAVTDEVLTETGEYDISEAEKIQDSEQPDVLQVESNKAMPEQREAEDSTKHDEAEDSTKLDVAEDSTKLDEAEDSTKRDEAEDSTKRDEPEDSTKHDVAEDSTKQDEAEDSTKQDVAEDSTKQDEAEDSTTPDVAEDSTTHDEAGDSTKRDEARDSTTHDEASATHGELEVVANPLTDVEHHEDSDGSDEQNHASDGNGFCSKEKGSSAH